MRVLIADDDRAIRLALRMALEDLGHELMVAEDGSTAWELFRQHGADAIISDWRMPGLEGPELCRYVRAQQTAAHNSGGYVYFILLTVLNEPRDILAGMQAGADDFLTKPFTMDTLQARLIAAERVTQLHRALAGRQAEQHQLAEDRRQLVEELRRERSQLHSVLQHLPAGVIIAAAPSGEIQMLNEQIGQIWRYSPASAAQAMQERRGFYPDGREYQPNEWPLMRSITTGEVVTGEEIDIVRGDGALGTIRVNASPILDGERVVAAVCIHHDITDDRRRQREAVQTEKLRALGQMAGGVAHDLNQSLALVTGYAELARGAFQQPASINPDEIMEMLQIITQAAYDGGETVKRLLTFSRMPTDGPAEIIDLPVLLDDVAKLTAPHWRDAAQAAGRPITLRVQAAAGARMSGWPSSLREALTNLIFNAVDALPTGGSINVGARVSGDRVVVGVRDSGVGMPADVQARIFEPFFTTKGENGTGLGLAMVFGIVERHQGTISIESAPGYGTTICMEFPLLTTTSPVVLGAATATGLSRHVLLVDDHVAIRHMASRMLTEHGHQVVHVETAEEALVLLDAQSFDILLTDVGLGDGLNGWQLAIQARQRWPEMRVILATGWAASIDPEAARSEGITEIIGKPFRSTELAKIIGAR